MANLKDVRDKIASTLSTQQITQAMKMVSAAKLRRAQTAITQMRPYEQKLYAIFANILASGGGGGSASAFAAQRPVENACMVVVTSNRGLAGAFNANIIKAAVQTIESQYAVPRQKGKLTIICIGKKGYDYFRRKYADCKVVGDYVNLFAKLDFGQSTDVSKLLMESFSMKKFDSVSVAYSRFKNAAMQFAESVQILPVTSAAQAPGAGSKMKADYLFEPDVDTLLEMLTPAILQTQFYKFLLDTHASEHGARMTSMDKATDNAQELLKTYRINYNKARQEAITKELSEIVGGAAALES